MFGDNEEERNGKKNEAKCYTIVNCSGQYNSLFVFFFHILKIRRKTTANDHKGCKIRIYLDAVEQIFLRIFSIWNVEEKKNDFYVISFVFIVVSLIRTDAKQVVCPHTYT